MSEENITVTGTRLPASYQQYLRTISLTVGISDQQLLRNVRADAEVNPNFLTQPSSQEPLDLSPLRVVFSIVAASASTPRQLNVRVYNLSQATAGKIQAEYDTISLSAGYQGRNGLLFAGAVQQKRYGRENPTDTFFDLFASDGYEILANGFISQSLAAGWSYADVYREIILAGAPLGLKAGTVPPDQPKGIRPLVLYGPLRKVMETLAKNLGLKWQIHDNILTFILPSVADPQIKEPQMVVTSESSISAVTVLSPSTGLIGIPAQTLDGIEATCLLNSRIKPGSLVKIDRSLITAGKNDLAVSAVNPYPSIAKDGIYRVMWTEHEGDTRGEPWFTHLVAESASPNDASTIQQAAIEKAGFAGGL